jgi:hypothetical protein
MLPKSGKGARELAERKGRNKKFRIENQELSSAKQNFNKKVLHRKVSCIYLQSPNGNIQSDESHEGKKSESSSVGRAQPCQG